MSDLIGPQQAILVTSRAEIEQFGKKVEKDDVESVFWHMPVSKEELLYCIAVHNGKHIVNLIKESGLFVVNFMPFDMEKKVHQCNLLHGEHLDKFEKLDLIKIECEGIECVKLKEACSVLECHVQETKIYSDYTIFIAKIINSKVVFDIKRLFHKKEDKYTTTKD